MGTILYLIRHAESVYVEGKERSRGLSRQGQNDALRIKHVMQDAPIDIFVSSPYERATATIKPLADERHKEIVTIEDLRERAIGDIKDISFREAKQRVYEDFHFAFADGESSAEAQDRGIQELLGLLQEHEGKSLAIGTHGDIMTLLMNYFDPQYDFVFWQSTSMPDIYRLEFDGGRLCSVTRLWDTDR
ncbi:histidine phosphatase family protein [Paenibacillus sp. PK3_47]|uniref:histidine phosphatase family protein n=1 Tax=Paenibacillus sp. PK3_47 TaxID=2072642 RepID=UPI00201DD46B|nr:histidine phosphatase family protein [Paenibacillus sp. PK3_47]UQZ35186.1 histidine phosphatase family protein [Paenibacillus sp. PK3_47]